MMRMGGIFSKLCLPWHSAFAPCTSQLQLVQWPTSSTAPRLWPATTWASRPYLPRDGALASSMRAPAAAPACRARAAQPTTGPLEPEAPPLRARPSRGLSLGPRAWRLLHLGAPGRSGPKNTKNAVARLALGLWPHRMTLTWL